MNAKQVIRAKRDYLRRESATYPVDRMKQVVPAILEGAYLPPISAWRNRYWLAQVFDEGGQIRVTVCRTEIDDAGKWLDGITWDQLQWIKNQIGFADRWAVEIFPPAGSVVNVANLRHLWILDQAPAFGWNREQSAENTLTPAGVVRGVCHESKHPTA